MKHKIVARFTTLALAGALVGGGFVALSAPAAVADSRCSAASHTHGALFWQRTDDYLGRFKNTAYKKWAFQHSNSQPVNCQSY